MADVDTLSALPVPSATSTSNDADDANATATAAALEQSIEQLHNKKNNDGAAAAPTTMLDVMLSPPNSPPREGPDGADAVRKHHVITFGLKFLLPVAPHPILLARKHRVGQEPHGQRHAK